MIGSCRRTKFLTPRDRILGRGLVMTPGYLLCFLPLILVLGLSAVSQAQELEPRRWSHLPMDFNFGGGAYVYTTGDIGFDPVLQIDDVALELHTAAFKYIRTFEFMGKSARVDFGQGYQDATWNGLLLGTPASVYRSGLTDASFRFAVNLLGAPPLKGKEFAEYRAELDSETIVGTALKIQLPTGDYQNDKLLNLGANRFSIKPQLGVVHSRGPWMAELTTAVWFYTENDEFWNGNRLEQAPFYTLQGHLIYTFRPGLWIGGGLGYGIGGEATINGVDKNDSRENLVGGISLGIPLSKKVGIKFSYIGIRTQKDVGGNTDNFAAGFSVLW